MRQDYLYVILDWICELLERDISYAYCFDVLTNDILKDFEEYCQSDFSKLLLGDWHIVEHLNSRGLVGVILHLLLYPQHDKIGIERLMTLFDKQYMMALLIKWLYLKKQSL